MDILLRILNELALVGVTFLAAVVVVAVHEYAHAFTSYKLGDNLPKLNRRLTLNPLSHIDMVGILFFMMQGVIGAGAMQNAFGWGKPVETSPRNYKDKKKGNMLAGLAGPLASIGLAVAALVFIQAIKIQTLTGAWNLVGYASDYLAGFLNGIYYFSFNLAFISLIPMSPFDGFLIWGKLISPRRQFMLFQYQRFMFTIFLLIVLIAPAALAMLISPIRAVIEISIYGIVNGVISVL